MENSCSCACGLPELTSENITTVSPDEFRERIYQPEFYLLDVRTPDEFKTGHIKGAHNLDVTNPDFEELAKKELPEDKVIAVYCGSGKRSAMAANKLDLLHFKVLNLEGGLTAWKNAGLPVT